MSDEKHDDVICICGQSSTGDPCLPGTTQGEPSEDGKCPKCHSSISSGYGLAYGGMGCYDYCNDDNNQNCDWFYKAQDSE